MVPKIRFKSFSAPLSKCKVKEILERFVSPVTISEIDKYREIGIRSHGRGLFHKDEVLGESLGNKRVFWIKKDALILNIVFAWEQAVALTSSKEEGFIASHRFPMYLPKNNRCNTDYVRWYFLTNKGKNLLELASPGGAGRNKTLGQKKFDELVLTIPELSEQNKITTFLNYVDEKIKLLNKQCDLLCRYKNGAIHSVFSQKFRFKDKNGEPFSEWTHTTLGVVLGYEQPTKYIVSSTDYAKENSTPVLTAGKKFILGYTSETEGIYNELPVIIFDDFTTSFKFVDFPFKVKSSAMKILKTKNQQYLLRYVFYAMHTIKYAIGDDHKRRWISEYSNISLPTPSLEEQEKIAFFFAGIDDKIAKKKSELNKLNTWKQGLMQQMFI
ncbi:restriction endonuclease subunit S [Citrobacter sp. OP27]